MITVEYPYGDDVNLVRHLSDSGMMIRQTQTGNLYVEAVDIYPTAFTYEETEIPIAQELLDEIEGETDTPCVDTHEPEKLDEIEDENYISTETEQ